MSRIKMASLVLILLHCATNAENLAVYTESLPPFQLIESDKISGSATVKVKQLLERANLKYDLHMVPWARAYNIVKTTPNTLIYSMNRSPEREPYFHWITVVAQIDNSFIALASKDLNITQLDDARKFMIAVIRDGYAHDVLLSQDFVVDVNMYVVATLDQQIALLLKGKVDFVFTGEQTIKYRLMQQNLDPALVETRYSQPAWSRDLYLAANINTSPKILKTIYELHSKK
ncbi:transporter substrate-binding domain-containing protein [Paraglaciecola sp.]|uniref:substrate-binding periplasmic protein n=1 Tax=Paraglaciecola sp. TaxID=1920173 RepID=UPI0030F37A54